MYRYFLSILFIFSFTNSFAQEIKTKLSISHVTGDFYVYTTYNSYQNTQVPANGMYIITNNGVVMLDTPWDTTQFQPLLDSIKTKHNKEVTLCIATHWHSDKTAGLEYYRQKGIKTYTAYLTDELSKINNKKRAENIIYQDTAFQAGQYTLETYYPGPGHTSDNIVIWCKQEKMLYAGCLVKAADAKDLGYLGDGNIQEYATTLKKVIIKYPVSKYIIISHGDWNNTNSLRHSLQLSKKLKRKSLQ